MTALTEYQRIEAVGIWRASPEEQRRDVIVSLGDASLTITDMQDRPLAHWSLPAVVRANPGKLPPIYHPDGDPGETLELAGDETDMTAAIEKLRNAIARQRPHPGRLRRLSLALSLAVVAALGVFWLPGALREHAVSVVPQVKRDAIGASLLARVTRFAGQPCAEATAAPALSRLAARLPAPRGRTRVVVMRSGVASALHLPGGIIVVSRGLIEDYEEPDVVAGFIVAEHLRAQLHDPLEALLRASGPLASFQLLTTGSLSDDTLETYAEHLLTAPPEPLPQAALLAAFRAWSVRAAPYAYARDVTGESVLGLIEADPFTSETPPEVLSDGDWLRLQGICGN